MTSLIHLIYCSAATKPFQDSELVDLLDGARFINDRLGITGMLLYDQGSFFQILEGSPKDVDQLYTEITKDKRHAKVVTIIREPIAKRSFADWTMGFSKISSQELDEIVGINDFFTEGKDLTYLNSGRAKKLVTAFGAGRWRSKVQQDTLTESSKKQKKIVMQPANMLTSEVTIAFQPIINFDTKNTMAYEAIVYGSDKEKFSDTLPENNNRDWSHFATSTRATAVNLAAKYNLSCDLHLKFLTHHVDDVKATIQSTLDAAALTGIDSNRIVLEINQERLVGDSDRLASILDEFRGGGLRISIDHFGAGRAGLNLLEQLRPDMISLNERLVRNVDTNGSRQAIVRGVLQTCNDLGIDLIAKHVSTYEEFEWFNSEGINLMQGSFFASPDIEKLPEAVIPQN